MEEKEAFLEKLQMCLKEAELKANKLNASFENLRGMSVIDHCFSKTLIDHLD